MRVAPSSWLLILGTSLLWTLQWKALAREPEILTRAVARRRQSVNQELLLQNEYLAAENRILRSKLPTLLRLTNPERVTLAEIGKRLGRKSLREVADIAEPDTILAWYRRLIA